MRWHQFRGVVSKCESQPGRSYRLWIVDESSEAKEHEIERKTGDDEPTKPAKDDHIGKRIGVKIR